MAIDKEIEETPLAKSRTMPDMFGPLPAKALMLAFGIPLFASIITHGSWKPFLMMPITLSVAFWLARKDVYMFEIVSAALQLKRAPKQKGLFGAKRYVPR